MYYHIECVGISECKLLCTHNPTNHKSSTILVQDEDLQMISFICPPCVAIGDKPRRVSSRRQSSVSYSSSRGHTKSSITSGCARPNCPRRKVKLPAREEEMEYTIEGIVGRKEASAFWRSKSRFEYLIKWEGEPPFFICSFGHSGWERSRDDQKISYQLRADACCIGYPVEESTWKPEHDFQHQIILPEFETRAYVSFLRRAFEARYSSLLVSFWHPVVKKV